MVEWVCCMFSNVTADVRRKEIKGRSCLSFEDKSLKHQIKSSVGFRTKGHDNASFIQCDHQHLLLTQMQNTRLSFN